MIVNDSRMAAICDRVEIVEVISSLTLRVDMGEFDGLTELFLQDATMEYGELFGAGSRSVPASQFLTEVRSWLPGFDATQHMVTNFVIQVDRDVATVRSQVTATHHLDGQIWSAGSVYRHTMKRTAAGWKIATMGVRFLHEQGDRGLIEQAAQRLAKRSATELRATRRNLVVRVRSAGRDHGPAVAGSANGAVDAA